MGENFVVAAFVAWDSYGPIQPCSDDRQLRRHVIG